MAHTGTASGVGICRRLESAPDDDEVWSRAHRLQLVAVRQVPGMPAGKRTVFGGTLSDGDGSMDVMLGPGVAEKIEAGKIRVYSILLTKVLKRCVILDGASRTGKDTVFLLGCELEAHEVVEAGLPGAPAPRRSFGFNCALGPDPRAAAVSRARGFLMTYGMTAGVAGHYAPLLVEAVSLQEVSKRLWELNICVLLGTEDGKDLRFMRAGKEEGRMQL
ncbi:hypothetical protein AURDEDRAFT_166387 [Auricularia subglabra TFB-10046 SS5]|uniref:Uncharacterized protein n=1 Tax=Auricularia subglabra (strain TFB-10046 / SS5) TaxID=717982 RepID=J0WZ71_AURST|nr:hypothetical protein AURDEDRAFT_166387 [Auricularia subglabra TFB-10046 SS5]